MIDDDDDRDELGDDAVRGGILPESVRKFLVTGISAVFMTEEGIRNALSDMRLPKEAMAYLVQQTDRSRRELFRAISSELKGFLNRVDLPGELRKALIGMKLQINAEIRFVPDEEPTVNATVTSVPSEPDEPDEPDDE